jgi:hypothetical protein
MKKGLSMILIIILLVGIVGCGKEKTPSYMRSKDIKGEYLLYDYEEYGRNFEILKLSENFGSLKKNNDKTYTKSGNSSLEIKPKGNRFKTTKPYFIIPTISERFNFGFSDFKDIYSVKFSIYNVGEDEVSVSVGMVLSSDYKSLSAYFETYALKSGWNEIEYVIWDGAQLSGVSGIYLKFDNYACTGKQEPTLYLDDFKLVQKDGLMRFIEIKDKEDGEICKIHDFSSLSYFGIAGYGDTYKAEWVSNTDLENMQGDYTGKAVKFTMPIHAFALFLTPRITREVFFDSVTEGYSKLTFYVALDIENGKPVHIFSDNTAYTGPTVKMEPLTWKKITVDITEKNKYSLYNEIGMRLVGVYVEPQAMYDSNGNMTTIHAYLGDIFLEK